MIKLIHMLCQIGSEKSDIGRLKNIEKKSVNTHGKASRGGKED